MYVWLIELNWNTCSALKNGGPTHIRPLKKILGQNPPRPSASDAPESSSD